MCGRGQRRVFHAFLRGMHLRRLHTRAGSKEDEIVSESVDPIPGMPREALSFDQIAQIKRIVPAFDLPL